MKSLERVVTLTVKCDHGTCKATRTESTEEVTYGDVEQLYESMRAAGWSVRQEVIAVLCPTHRFKGEQA